MRSGMVPFERASVSPYRPSIVTFPLSLRVSEILPLLSSHFTDRSNTLLPLGNAFFRESNIMGERSCTII